MNKGIARKEKESIPVTQDCAISISGVSVNTIKETRVAIPYRKNPKERLKPLQETRFRTSQSFPYQAIISFPMILYVVCRKNPYYICHTSHGEGRDNKIHMGSFNAGDTDAKPFCKKAPDESRNKQETTAHPTDKNCSNCTGNYLFFSVTGAQQ